MFATRYFPARYFAPSYWTKVGADPPVVVGNDVAPVTSHISLEIGIRSHISLEIGAASHISLAVGVRSWIQDD